MQTQAIAEKHSANCFLNSLFREWSDFYHDIESSSFVVHLKNNNSLIIPLSYYSLIGRHEYADLFFIKDHQTDKLSEINFLEIVHILLGHLSESYKTTPEQLNTFVERIENSLKNISSALEQRSDELIDLYNQSEIDFQDAEQALIIGHTFHPHPKSRDEFSVVDYQTYAPETGGEFFMHWFLVKPEFLHQHASKNFKDKNWPTTLFSGEFEPSFESDKLLRDGYVPFPVHPWQREVILRNTNVKKYITENKIIDFGKSFSEEKWLPTSSLRSVYRKSSPYMLKFSLSVRLTNSIRHLLPLEVVRGLQVMDVFSTKAGQEFLNSYPNLNVVYEPGFMALVDQDKKIINETIVAMRLNPFNEGSSSQKLVLATLTQDHPISGLSLIGNMIKKYSKENLMTKDNGNVLDEKMGNILFSYYLIINSTFNVISTIAKDTGSNESVYMNILRENLIEWKSKGVKDSTCFDYLLNEKQLLQKGNFLCSFTNMNENTTENPLNIYNPIPNPLYEKENVKS